MTDAQYRRLGRVVDNMAKLIEKVESIYNIRSLVIEDLTLLLGREDANKIEASIMSSKFPSSRMHDVVIKVVELIEGQAKK